MLFPLFQFLFPIIQPSHLSFSLFFSSFSSPFLLFSFSFLFLSLFLFLSSPSCSHLFLFSVSLFFFSSPPSRTPTDPSLFLSNRTLGSLFLLLFSSSSSPHPLMAGTSSLPLFLLPSSSSSLLPFPSSSFFFFFSLSLSLSLPFDPSQTTSSRSRSSWPPPNFFLFSFFFSFFLFSFTFFLFSGFQSPKNPAARMEEHRPPSLPFQTGHHHQPFSFPAIRSLSSFLLLHRLLLHTADYLKDATRLLPPASDRLPPTPASTRTRSRPPLIFFLFLDLVEHHQAVHRRPSASCRRPAPPPSSPPWPTTTSLPSRPMCEPQRTRERSGEKTGEVTGEVSGSFSNGKGLSALFDPPEPVKRKPVLVRFNPI